jgi:hypothetical protein
MNVPLAILASIRGLTRSFSGALRVGKESAAGKTYHWPPLRQDFVQCFFLEGCGVPHRLVQ